MPKTYVVVLGERVMRICDVINHSCERDFSCIVRKRF